MSIIYKAHTNRCCKSPDPSQGQISSTNCPKSLSITTKCFLTDYNYTTGEANVFLTV